VKGGSKQGAGRASPTTRASSVISDGSAGFSPDSGRLCAVIEPEPDGAPLADADAIRVIEPPPRHRLRAIPAFAIASMLVAGGLLMAVGGMVRLVEPAPPTPTPTAAPSVTPAPTPVVPSTPPLGPTASPRG
jgi:hypothetical protein